MRQRQPGEDHAPVVDLADLDEAFASAARSSSAAFPPVPDGPYVVRVEEVDLTRGKQSGNRLLKWRLRILGPTSAGRLLWHNHLLTTPRGLRWLKHDLDVCGLELARLSDLPARLERLVGLELEVVKRTRATWANVYFDRRRPDRPSSGGAPF